MELPSGLIEVGRGVVVEFEPEPRLGPFGGLLGVLVRLMVHRCASRMLAAWAAAIEAEGPAAAADGGSRKEEP